MVGICLPPSCKKPTGRYDYGMSIPSRKKKQPEVVRTKLVEAAAEVVIQRGLPGLTLEMVARKAGVSKGGLIYHFPNKQTLIEGLHAYLLDEFEEMIQGFIDADPEPRGRFLRSYVKASVAGRTKTARLFGAFAVAMGHDDSLSAIWRDWLHRQLKKNKMTELSVAEKAIRYAADGLWMEDCTGVQLATRKQRQAVVDYLVESTYTGAR